MPKKKFEESPYDPIAADLMREVAAGTRGNLSLATSIPTLEREAPAALPPASSPSAVAVAPVSANPAPRLPEPTITKRFLLTRSENEDLEAFLLRLQKQAGTKVTLSTFARAVINVAMQAEEQLMAEIGGGGPRRFPSTHDSIAQGAFEDWWMRCLASAFRKTPRGSSSLRTL